MIKHKKTAKKIVITDFQHYWKSPTEHGHVFQFAHGGPEHDQVELFEVELQHSDKKRGQDGRWMPVHAKKDLLGQ